MTYLASCIQVILIDRNPQNKIEIEKIVSTNHNRKMPVFHCLCGINILIVPDLPAMNKAIKNHITEHKKLTGSGLTEEILTQKILKVVIKAINEP